MAMQVTELSDEQLAAEIAAVAEKRRELKSCASALQAEQSARITRAEAVKKAERMSPAERRAMQSILAAGAESESAVGSMQGDPS